jgi:hypothetical protein
MSQAGLERQMAGTALATKGNSSSPYHNEVLTIGEALYRLTGLLALQRLYAALLDEKKQLEAHLAKQYQVNDQLSSREKSCSSGENHVCIFNLKTTERKWQILKIKRPKD